MATKQQPKADNWNGRFFSSVTKMEGLPIPDADGHFVGMMVIEGVAIYDNGELAWLKAVVIFDATKRRVPFSQYTTTTFQDGATITTYAKSTGGGPTANWTEKTIHGTGRFQGVKGTMKISVKYLPHETGGVGRKIVGKFTSAFTLPAK
jgi:hypothetical protein